MINKVLWERSKFSPLLWLERLFVWFFVPKAQFLCFSLFVSGHCWHCGKKTHFIRKPYQCFLCPGHCYEVEDMTHDFVMENFVPSMKTSEKKLDLYYRLMKSSEKMIATRDKLLSVKHDKHGSVRKQLKELNLRLIPVELLESIVREALELDLNKVDNVENLRLGFDKLWEFSEKKG